MSELIVQAEREELDRILAFVEEKLDAAGCPEDVKIAIDIAVEEIFVNIASYAYETGEGTATICVSIEEVPLQVQIIFIDQGKQYNPLERTDPDISQKLEDRQIGGLGIYMVKEIMDETSYEYKEGSNILTIKKKI